MTSRLGPVPAVLEADDELAGREQALALVRGPVLHGSFDRQKNSPFSWAVDERPTSSRTRSPALPWTSLWPAWSRVIPARAARAVSQGLLCSEANLRLRTVDLGSGPPSGDRGGRPAPRSGRAAMATFPQDVAELEGVARRLGWEAPVSG